VEGHEDEAEHEGRGFPGVGERELLVLFVPYYFAEELYPLPLDVEVLPERVANLYRAASIFSLLRKSGCHRAQFSRSATKAKTSSEGLRITTLCPTSMIPTLL
jgi:hypothetical protein